MLTKALIGALSRNILRFRAECGGNVAVMFALALVPVAGAVGAAVDYSHANSVKVAMQAAVDATALKLAKEAASLNNSELDKKATAYFKAVFNRKETREINVTPTYSKRTGRSRSPARARSKPTSWR
jgi:Flp pilus assembly protein TadG